MTSVFTEEYKRLNKAQKEAVDTIDGPVMVVAGPGTGKTQILALRIANILKKTDIKADGLLALTFTNGAVGAMKKRLALYIGEAGEKVNIFTFHSFGMKIIGEYYEILGLHTPPTLLDDADTAIIFGEILENNDWQYLRPRADGARYFSDLKSLITLLKRERVGAKYFLSEVEKEMRVLESDPENISQRGESKGQLKKEVLNKIEGLKRSEEFVKFFNLYEEVKKERNVFDYDDVLENLVKITELSPDTVSDMREQYLYILVDEHQDSSAVQNQFLKNVWGTLESPDIFVVGDDRQLIYGFSGASIDHFQGFKKTFKNSKLITLVDNYRSTQVILDASHALLRSTMTEEKLMSQSKENHPLRLLEVEYPDDEIIASAMDIKKKIKNGVKASDCAILVPKNSEVRSALKILHGEGLGVSSLDAFNLFDEVEAQAFLRVLKIISDPAAAPALAVSFFDQSSGITPLEAHTYLALQNMREFSFAKISEGKLQKLFGETSSVDKWIGKLSRWKKLAQNKDVLTIIQTVGAEFFLESKNDDDKLVSGKEILDTILSLIQKEVEKNQKLTLEELVSFLDRLENYGETIPLLVGEKEGVKVLTLHSSKGLEFDYVWIAHMDESSLNRGKRMGFVLPEAIAEKVLEKDVDATKRKLYVAITRAKRFCTISYALHSSRGGEQEIGKVIRDLPEEIFEKQRVQNIPRNIKTVKNTDILDLIKLVAEKYRERKVSVSLLNNFFECPWKWYFRNLLQLPEPKQESLEFGNAVHGAIDEILKLGHNPSLGELESLGLDKEAMGVVSRWVSTRLSEIKLQRETEKSVSTKDNKFPLLNIYGKIDLVEYLSECELRVTDFKTGSVKKKSDIEKLDEDSASGGVSVRMSPYLRQLAMYSYLIQNGTKSSVRESRLEFLEAKNKKEIFYDRIITQKEIELLLKDIEDYDNLVKKGEWVNRPCNYNSYGKATVCEYCKLAEIYK